MNAVLRPSPRVLRFITFGTAMVWLFHGLFSKVLNGIPRHRMIVERVLGTAWAEPATFAIGGAEILMAAWILTGRAPRLCAAIQTVALAAMNVLEIRLARDLLLAPWAMVVANVLFLALGWFLALNRTRGVTVPRD